MEIKYASLGRFLLLKTLGIGETCKVKLGFDPIAKTSYAIKILKPLKTIQEREELERELDILSYLKHPNVVDFIEFLDSVDYVKKNGTSYKVLAIVFEYVEGGDLSEFISLTGILSEETARVYFKILMDTLEYCHKQGVAHRSIKPENILLDENVILKISGFGLATFIGGPENDYQLHTFDGTELYMAPEMYRGEPYNGAPIDIFACGVVLFIMVNGYPPFYKADPRLDLFYKKLSLKKYGSFWGHHERERSKDHAADSPLSSEFQDLVNGMLNPDPAQRLTVEQIKQDPWYNGPVPSLEDVKKEFLERKSKVSLEMERKRLEQQQEKNMLRKKINSEINSGDVAYKQVW